jgi:hypothetical protein
MSGGQHRDDEVNGPSRSGQREAERSRDHDSQPSAAAQTNGCAREKQKPKQNVLDGADFVRDVLESYPARLNFDVPTPCQIRRAYSLPSLTWYLLKRAT